MQTFTGCILYAKNGIGTWIFRDSFAAPEDTGWRVRYFAPAMEVDFCGHATIALGAALARQHGNGSFSLRLNRADITVEGYSSEREWGASFMSPPTRSKPVTSSALEDALGLFGLSYDRLAPKLRIRYNAQLVMSDLIAGEKLGLFSKASIGPQPHKKVASRQQTRD